MIDKRKMTAKEASEKLGISERQVRRYCARPDCPGADFHPFFEGSSRGVYLLTERTLRWLKRNVPAYKRNHPEEVSG